VNVLLEKGKAAEAREFLDKRGGGMKAEDLLRAQTAVTKVLNTVRAEQAAEDVDRLIIRPAVQPNDSTRLLNLLGPLDLSRLTAAVRQEESGGKRYGPDGKLLTSPKGAQGEMQVMPGTQRDPGYGVVPAKDGSPEEIARVGRWPRWCGSSAGTCRRWPPRTTPGPAVCSRPSSRRPRAAAARQTG
jgi:hypothetical protein